MRNYLTNRPNNFGLDLFDEFDNFFKPFSFGGNNYMNTDVTESDKALKFSIDVPGFNKNDLSITLKDGYLTVEAKRETSESEKDNYLRRERKMSYSRSFYVGDAVTEEDVTASYENGTLVIDVPKLEEKVKPQKRIEIK